MMSKSSKRTVIPDDAAQLAAIKNLWIDESEWLPRVQMANELELHYREMVIPKREVYVIGNPIEGFISLDRSENFIVSLFCKTKSKGFGKQLMDHAKIVRDHELKLWSFIANEGACRFYQREGFQEIDKTDGDNEERLPELLMRWEGTQND